MMKITAIPVRPIGANTYLLEDEETKKCLIIDLGGDFDKIKRWRDDRGSTAEALLFTHGHFDHVSGGADAKACGIPAGFSENDEHMLSGDGNLAEEFGYPYAPFSADFRFSGGEELDFGPFRVKVIATPGHSAGSVCFLIGGVLFSGDTLFCRSYGRTDFADGNGKDLRESITKKLFLLPEKTVVYPGHGDKTTIGEEILYNPIRRDL